MAQSTEFMIALSNYFENKSPENYKIAFDILTRLRNDFYARLKLIDPTINPGFHMYVLDSDFKTVVSTNTNPTVENAISATYQAANLDPNYTNSGTIDSYRKNFTPAVPVYENEKLIAEISALTVANYSVNATYEGSYKALYFGSGCPGNTCNLPVCTTSIKYYDATNNEKECYKYCRYKNQSQKSCGCAYLNTYFDSSNKSCKCSI